MLDYADDAEADALADDWAGYSIDMPDAVPMDRVSKLERDLAKVRGHRDSLIYELAEAFDKAQDPGDLTSFTDVAEVKGLIAHLKAERDRLGDEIKALKKLKGDVYRAVALADDQLERRKRALTASGGRVEAASPSLDGVAALGYDDVLNGVSRRMLTDAIALHGTAHKASKALRVGKSRLYRLCEAHGITLKNGGRRGGLETEEGTQHGQG